VKQPDFPGPGEQTGPDHIPTEANDIPIPDGELRAIDCRHTQELPAVRLYDPEEWHELAEGKLRRTGTDRDRIPAVRAEMVAETRLDYSAYGREVSLDTVQDDSGPQSDQG